MNQHLTVKELPESEKPYEKCLRYGAEYLSDAELLAVIIRSGTAGKQSTVEWRCRFCELYPKVYSESGDTKS